ncbi:MAG: hypothetical protein K1X28_02445 [Parachlamydiales bacterium]|nr:hypothetical protein [Parachlamydiales bacterium]
MSFLSGVGNWFSHAASYASQQVETVRNLRKEDVAAAAKKVSDAGLNMLQQVQCFSCADVWQLFNEPQVEPAEEGGEEEEEELVAEGAGVQDAERGAGIQEPGWEHVPAVQAPPKDDLNDPYSTDDAQGVKRRRKKTD